MNDKRNENLDRMKQEVFQMSKNYKVALSSEAGKAMLLDLRQQFEHNTLIADDPHSMVIRASQREVIDYITRMLRIEGDEQ